ncbi:hypothetical protein ACUJ46_02535 [Sandaracinobacteroides sp. A072]|uniref:hypothetical protein n=1 Tax=Sandaracinobacteroides sp. A072 TaxID=3461146 RepID=UPI004042D3F4
MPAAPLFERRFFNDVATMFVRRITDCQAHLFHRARKSLCADDPDREEWQISQGLPMVKEPHGAACHSQFIRRSYMA